MDERPNEEELREVYARFGLAYYFTEVLHASLANIYALAPFSSKDEIYKLRLEERYSLAWSTTLGQLMIKIDADMLPNEIINKFEKLLESRNSIAHGFWFKRIPHMHSLRGIEKLIGELDDVINEFRETNKVVSEIVRNKSAQLGITESELQQSSESVMSGHEMPDLHQQRRLKKNEHVANIYIVEIDRGKTLVFQTKDRELWQLSEVGLAWSPFDEVKDEWTEIEEIKSYLPATIRPRPQIENPWHYAFQLSENVHLKVSLRDNNICWSIDGND